jgi:hypothetical protein
LRQDEAIAHAIRNAEAAERLLAVEEAPSGLTPGGHARTADKGPYGVYEEQRTARYNEATAHAEIAQAWAAIARQLPSQTEAQARDLQDRHWENAERRSR